MRWLADRGLLGTNRLPPPIAAGKDIGEHGPSVGNRRGAIARRHNASRNRDAIHDPNVEPLEMRAPKSSSG